VTIKSVAHLQVDAPNTLFREKKNMFWKIHLFGGKGKGNIDRKKIHAISPFYSQICYIWFDQVQPKNCLKSKEISNTKVLDSHACIMELS
jgi:hypothetical protein